MINNPPTMEESWVGKIPWRRAWQLTPVYLPGESHEQKNIIAKVPTIKCTNCNFIFYT